MGSPIRRASVFGSLQRTSRVADLSTTFVNLPCEQMAGMIDDSLKMLVESLGIDRSTLAEFTQGILAACRRVVLGYVATNKRPPRRTVIPDARRREIQDGWLRWEYRRLA
jgi:alkylation response protein AidB-like acyl-CoA dehydrogenase